MFESYFWLHGLWRGGQLWVKPWWWLSIDTSQEQQGRTTATNGTRCRHHLTRVSIWCLRHSLGIQLHHTATHKHFGHPSFLCLLSAHLPAHCPSCPCQLLHTVRCMVCHTSYLHWQHDKYFSTAFFPGFSQSDWLEEQSD